MIVTDRDVELMPLPALRLRIVAEQQVLAACWPPTQAGRKNGQRRLRAYCRAGLWRRQTVHAKAVHRVQLLSAGGPDDPLPDCDALARACQSAWRQLPTRPQVIYSATRRARLLFGGTERHQLHALPQLSHDLGVSAAYFELRRTEPELARAWRSEDDRLLPDGYGDAQPDAVLVDANEQPVIAVEFAADYSARRFERLVATFCEQQLAHRIYGALP